MELTLNYIENKFSLYNKEYFYNKLPKPNFKIINSRKYLGLYSYSSSYNCYHERVSKNCISISKYYDIEEKLVDNILIHEMIHYYLRYTNNDDNVCHGTNFMLEAYRINKYGWNITPKTNTNGWKIRTSKTYRICIFEENKDAYFIFSFSKPNEIKFKNWLEKNQYNNNVVFETNDEIFDTFPQCRNLIKGRRIIKKEIDKHKDFIKYIDMLKK